MKSFKDNGMVGWHDHFWEADHIVPVIEGGTNELANLRTLCMRCHRAETAKLRRRRRKQS